jgi:ubiquitin-activating enzyme E1
MAATYGGIIGQEILKAVSNKYTPIFQFLAIGAIESLPTTINFSVKNDRYDSYHRVFEMNKLK